MGHGLYCNYIGDQGLSQVWATISVVTVQVIEGSHKCGRIDHDLEAGQQRCNEERLQQIRNNLPHKFVEMDPGQCKITIRL